MAGQIQAQEGKLQGMHKSLDAARERRTRAMEQDVDPARRQEFGAARDQYLKSQSELTRSRSERSKLQSERSRLTALTSQETRNLSRAEQTVSRETSALSQVDSELRSAQGGLNSTGEAARDAAQNRVNDLNARRSEIQARLQAATTERDNCRKRLEELRKQTAQNEQDLRKTETSIQQAERSSSEALGKMDKARNKPPGTSQKELEGDPEIQRLQGEIRQVESGLEKLRQRLQELDLKISEAASREALEPPRADNGGGGGPSAATTTGSEPNGSVNGNVNATSTVAAPEEAESDGDGLRDPNETFVTQTTDPNYNPGGPGTSANCGPASVVNAAAGVGLLPPELDYTRPGGPSAEAVIEEMRRRGTGANDIHAFTYIWQMERAVRSVGGETRPVHNLNDVHQALLNGDTVVLAGNPNAPGAYGVGQGINYNGGHFITVTGVDTSFNPPRYIIQDPLSHRGSLVVTGDQLTAYMSDNNAVNQEGFSVHNPRNPGPPR
ncbi:MAG: hypothetical protein AB1758_37915, partial [Candidatus Eremiobacterota bacterium]